MPETPKRIQPITIMLDQTRRILLDLRAIYNAERKLAEAYGEKRISLMKMFESGDVSFTELVHLLWAGLLHEMPQLTVDQTLGLCQSCDMATIGEAIGSVFKQHLGAKAGAGEDPQKAQTSGTGSESGPSGGSISG